MNRTRRRLLAVGGALGAALWAPAIHGAAAPRVVVVGGGWGGLAAARRLRQRAPGFDVTLVDRSPDFFSLPLSNRWLVGRLDAAMLRFDLRERAATLGYRFVAAEVGGIDRVRRELQTSAGAIGYDWLVLACGIRQDWGAWTGGDAAAARRIEAACGNGFEGGEALRALKARFDRFEGGELLMNVPPMPYRCPPAPYERALLIASEIRRRRLRARLTVLDPGAGILGFPKVFADRWREEIRFVPHTSVLSVDLDARRVATEVQDFGFDAAILMPPQRAGALVERAGLVAGNGWAEVSPLDLRSAADPRVFVVGDAVGQVSPLFGAYPKSGHVAVRLGQIAAEAILRAAQGGGGAAATEAAPVLPDSVCHVLGDLDPPEAIRIDARYRVRGDGVIAQTVTQARDPQPRGEDLAWAKAMFAEMFGAT
jgi:NADPH-dependent 2,4-dienoyl-CoA reductase/sulfur reductase-like enzyme